MRFSHFYGIVEHETVRTGFFASKKNRKETKKLWKLQISLKVQSLVDKRNTRRSIRSELSSILVAIPSMPVCIKGSCSSCASNWLCVSDKLQPRQQQQQ